MGRPVPPRPITASLAAHRWRQVSKRGRECQESGMGVKRGEMGGPFHQDPNSLPGHDPAAHVNADL